MSLKTILTACLFASLAGCAGPEPFDEPQPADPEPDAEVPADPVVQTWDGYITAGAAYELPAHFVPSEQYVEPLWKGGFLVETQEPPDVLEFRLDWSAASPGAELWFMVHGPHGAERENESGWSEYTTDFISHSPACMQIPSEDIIEDLELAKGGGHQPYWYPMIHSQFGFDFQATITVTSIGGSVTLPDEWHGHDSTPEEFMNLYETEVGPKRVWNECEHSDMP